MLVAGFDPVISAEFYVSYHNAGMPDLYDPAVGFDSFPGPDRLIVANSSGLTTEDPLTGLPVPDDAERVIVFVHGWNPDDHDNHYAPTPGATTVDSPLDFKWVLLLNNLMGNAAVQEGTVG